MTDCPPDGYGQQFTDPPKGYRSWTEFMEKVSEQAAIIAKPHVLPNTSGVWPKRARGFASLNYLRAQK